MSEETKEPEKKAIKFQCLNCGSETKVTAGVPTTMQCQVCGCLDIKFNTPILMFPFKVDQSMGEPEILDIGDLAFGRHAGGLIWVVKENHPDTEGKPEQVVPPSSISEGKLQLKVRAKKWSFSEGGHSWSLLPLSAQNVGGLLLPEPKQIIH